MSGHKCRSNTAGTTLSDLTKVALIKFSDKRPIVSRARCLWGEETKNGIRNYRFMIPFRPPLWIEHPQIGGLLCQSFWKPSGFTEQLLSPASEHSKIHGKPSPDHNLLKYRWLQKSGCRA